VDARALITIITRDPDGETFRMQVCANKSREKHEAEADWAAGQPMKYENEIHKLVIQNSQSMSRSAHEMYNANKYMHN
jgi:hypothetical protein